MVQSIEQPDIFGRIGKAIGEGVSEQVPRSMLASQLEKAGLPKNIAGLSQYPGGEAYIPLVQQYSQTEAFKNKGQPSLQNTPNTLPVTSVPSSSNQKPSASSNLLTSPEEITKYKQTRLQPVDQNAIDEKARIYLGRGEEINFRKAQERAQGELKTDLEAQQEATRKFATDLNSRVALGLQRSGLGGDSYKDVAGEIQKRLVDEGEYEKFVKGLSAEAAAEKIDKILTDLGKATTSVKAAGELPYTDTKLKIQDFKKGKKEYDKYGFGEIYNDIVTTAADITPMEAASFLDPLKNEPLQKALEKAVKPKNRFAVDFLGFARNLGDDALDSIISKIKPEDNILSIEHYLRDNDIDLSDFKRRLTDTHYDKLTDRQRRELGKPVRNSFIGDLFFRAFK